MQEPLTVRVIRRTPGWCVALALTLAVAILATVMETIITEGWRLDRPSHWHSYVSVLYTAVLFIVGPIQRSAIRQIAVGSVVGVTVAIGLQVLDSSLREPIAEVIADLFLLTLSVGSFESLALRLKTHAVMPWLVAVSVAAAAVFLTFRTYVYYCYWDFDWDWDAYGYFGWMAENYAMRALLVWLAVPFAFWTALYANSRGKILTFGGAGVCAAGAILFTANFRYQLAKWSLLDRGAFDRYSSVSLLADRGELADYDVLRDALKRNIGDPRARGRDGYGRIRDWRQACIDALAKNDPAGTAQLVSEIFSIKASADVLEYSAPVLAAEERYDMVPLLLRFAFPMRDRLSDSPCLAALEKLGVRQAAMPALADVVFWKRMVGDDSRLRPEEREYLTGFFGEDLGPDPNNWFASYDDVVSRLPTTLSPERDALVEREVDVYLKYEDAQARWRTAYQRLATEQLIDDGHEELLNRFTEQLRIASSLDDPRLKGPLKVIRKYLDAAQEKLRVAPPDSTVPTTAEWEQEVESYIDAVDDVAGPWLPTNDRADEHDEPFGPLL